MSAPWEANTPQPDCECTHAHDDHERHAGYKSTDYPNRPAMPCTIAGCACEDYYPNAAYWQDVQRDWGQI